MKTFSTVIAFAGASLSLMVSLKAAVVSYDFETQTEGDVFDGEVTGWSQDTGNPEAFGVVFPIGYISTIDFSGSGSGTNTGFLGTYRGNTPDNASTTVTGDLSGVGAIAAGDSSVTFNLAIIDDSTDQFTTRDEFSVVVRNDSSGEVARIDLAPNAFDETLWNVSIGVNGAPTVGALYSLEEGFGYQISIEFEGGQTRFLHRSSVGGGTYIGLGNLAPVTSGDFGDIQMIHNPQGLAGSSANALVFDNIVAVPEPSSSSLLLLGLAGALGWRRRSKH